MHPDPLSRILATALTAGCAAIHAGRHRADDVTMLLVLVMVGLVNACRAKLASRAGATLDPGVAIELVSHPSHHD